MLIAIRNIKHNGVEYFPDEEVPETAFTEDQLNVLIEDGAVKKFKSLSEKKRVDEQEKEATPEAPATPKEEVKTESKPAVEESPKTVEEFGEPSEDWSKQKMLDYAGLKGISEVKPEQTKPEILALIKPASDAGSESVKNDEGAGEATPDKPADTTGAVATE